MIRFRNLSLSDLSFYAICLVAFTLPLSMEINTYSIILAVIINFFYIIKTQAFKLLMPNKKNVLLIVYYLILVISLTYTENIGLGLKKLEYNASFVIMPLFFWRIKSLEKREYEILLKVFIYSVIAVSFVFLVIAFFKYLKLGDSNVFFYHSLSSPFEFHAVYFSIYISFALIVLLYKLNISNIKIFLPVFIYLIIILILLSSKSIIFFVFILLSYSLASWKKIKFKRFILLGIIFSLFMFLILGNRFEKNRFKEIANLESLSILKEDSMTDFNMVNGLTLRLMIVKYSILESLKNPFTFLVGQGSGDKQMFLDSVYEKHNMAKVIAGEKVGYYGYNAHNQYIETFISVGFIGLLYLLFMFIKFFKFVKSNYVAISFFILFLWAFFFESILAVNKGIVFFVFWSIIFNSMKLNENCNFRNSRDSQ